MNNHDFDPIGWQQEMQELIDQLPDRDVAQRVREAAFGAMREELRGTVAGEAPPLDGIRPVEEPNPDAGQWLTDYVAYASKALPMGPSIYHEALGLWALSAAIARRVQLRVSNTRIFPNLFILLVGPPTLTHKSSSLRTVQRLVDAAGISTLPPGLMTPEALEIELSTRPPANIEKNPIEYELWKQERALAAQRSWILDEASGLFESTRRDYMSQIKPILLRWYDCPERLPFTITVSRGRMEARNTYLAFAGATTPSSMRAYFDKRATEWGDGTWARFNLITHECFEEFEFFPQRVEMPAELTRRLAHLYDGALKVPAVIETENSDDGTITKQLEVADLQGQSVQIADAAWSGWKAYARAIRTLAIEDYHQGSGRLAGLYGRMHIHAIKIAMLLAAADWADAGAGGAVTITVPHWRRAQYITEKWRESLHRLERRLLVDKEQEQNQKREDATYKVLKHIQESGEEGIKHRDVLSRFHRVPDLDVILEQLLDDGFIQSRKTKNKRGPKGTVYYVERPNSQKK